MIQLEVEPYCQECLEFKPDMMQSAVQTLSGEFQHVNTTIFCEHKNRCKQIEKVIKQGLRMDGE